MKKPDEELKLHQLRRAGNQFKRQFRKVRGRKRQLSAAQKLGTLISAPAYIDMYIPKNHSKMVLFLAEVRQNAVRGRVTICFRNTQQITAAGGLLLVAEVDRLVKHFGQSRISCTRPPLQRNQFGQESHRVEGVLSQIGFFRLLGQKDGVSCNEPWVACWDYESGEAASGEIAGKILQKVEEKVTTAPARILYRGCIEAISNCVEHAYTGRRADGMPFDDKRWWMFAAVLNNQLVILVCDLGVGIPNTIQVTQPPTLLDTLFSLFGFTATKDAEWIKAATLVKETRTMQSHRGKGGGDLRSLLKVDDTAMLRIFSNRGHYRCRNTRTSSGKRHQPERIFDNHHSILGTIIEWSIDLGSNHGEITNQSSELQQVPGAALQKAG